jgi:hypothetical protein
MTQTELIAEVRSRLAETTADYWSDDQVKRMLDEGVRRFCHEARWPWLFTVQKNIPVVAGNPDIEAIDDVDLTRHLAVVLVRNSDSRVIIPSKVTPSDGVRMRTVFNTNAEPRFWYSAKTVNNTYIDGDGPDVAQIITLVPTPDVAYTAEYHYYREPAALTSTTEPEVPPQYQEAVIAWATYELWKHEVDATVSGPKAGEQLSTYNKVVADALREFRGLADDESIVWGKQDPEPQWPMTTDEWVRAHIPTTIPPQ